MSMTRGAEMESRSSIMGRKPTADDPDPIKNLANKDKHISPSARLSTASLPPKPQVLKP